MSDEFFWDNLLMHIESGRVVPIVGQGLLQVELAGQTMSLQRFLAGRLAEDFKLSTEALTADSTISDIFCHPNFPKEKRISAYARIKYHLDAAKLNPPKALRQLAQIRPLTLFISMTFDDLLTRALNAERFDGAARTEVITYSRREVRDLPPPEARGGDAMVYHLFGQATPMPYFAVTDADYLEFFNALIGERALVPNLSTLLNQRNLLFLGTGFPDWLARFLLRFTKREALNAQRDFTEIFADASVRQDPGFMSFVNNFSQQTIVYEEGGAIEFVAELHRRWFEKYPEREAQSLPQPSAGESGPIFISYASEDFSQASRLCEQLTAAGLTVWFDKKPEATEHTLIAGDDYESKIERSIRSSMVFIPVISRSVFTNKGRFFRKEWSWALDQSTYFTGLSRRFILPVIVDETSMHANDVPDKFGLLHAVRAPGGTLTTRDCSTIVSAARGDRGGRS